MRTPRRVIVFAPHPDDESIATGGLLIRLAATRAETRVAFLTDGENNPWPHRALLRRWHLSEDDRARYAAVRRDEAREALSILGLPSHCARFLGLPDQGLTRLARTNPFEVIAAIRSLLAEFEPDLIVAPSAVDLHPDHHAAALLVTAARAAHGCDALAYVVHGAPPPGQPRFQTSLTPRERERKRRAIAAHRTQMILSRGRYLRYADADERLHDASDSGPVVARSLRRLWFLLRSDIASRCSDAFPPPEPARTPAMTLAATALLVRSNAVREPAQPRRDSRSAEP